MPQLSSREYRDFNLGEIEVRSAETGDQDQYIVEGYAMKWAPYPLYEYDGEIIYEEFKRSCFEGCDMSDIIFQENHEGQVLARLRNDTLEIILDDIGMFFRANLSLSQKSRDLYEAVKNRLMDRMSWGFAPDQYEYDKLTRTIVHTRVKKVYDISAVSIPANENTSISSVRSFANGEISRMAQELRERERHEKALKTATLIKLGGI